ncbi:DUF397 domain-containing protein [Sphaerisporangium album]|uniref:DUF397 domain-containing protein n=1 Tax=Sphaerisporangium album TaxID=509200 RepID=A0A367FLN9_9ACTN|nr:DUF397 domain-containing protein [Sphaerisporangium album]RCG30809.1 DUF397 domain-containing protein [Sphaerisporangium album]
MDLVTWRKSSYSSANGGECIEVAKVPNGIAVRDSKDPARGHLMVSAEAFNAFLAAVRA